jgi:hypothetical protein
VPHSKWLNLYLTDTTVEEGIKTQACGTRTRQRRKPAAELRDPLPNA